MGIATHCLVSPLFPSKSLSAATHRSCCTTGHGKNRGGSWGEGEGLGNTAGWQRMKKEEKLSAPKAEVLTSGGSCSKGSLLTVI